MLRYRLFRLLLRIYLFLFLQIFLLRKLRIFIPLGFNQIFISFSFLTFLLLWPFLLLCRQLELVRIILMFESLWPSNDQILYNIKIIFIQVILELLVFLIVLFFLLFSCSKALIYLFSFLLFLFPSLRISISLRKTKSCYFCCHANCYWYWRNMLLAYVVMSLTPQSDKIFRIQTFFVISLAATNTTITSSFSGTRISRVTFTAIMSRTSKQWTLFWYFYYCFTSMVRELIQKSFRKQTIQMVKPRTFAAFMNNILALICYYSFVFWSSWSARSWSWFLPKMSISKTYRTPKNIVFMRTVRTFFSL